MCGLPFSGKSVLARSLSHELGIRLLSYDFEIYLPHRHLVPPGSSVAAGYDFVQDIARRQIGAILAAGQSLVYDDLLLERDDRRKLAGVAHQHRADLVLVYLDTPLAVIDQRQAENARTRTRHSVPEGEMQLDASLLEPPDTAEQAIPVRPGDDLADVLTRIRARLRPEGHASLLPAAAGRGHAELGQEAAVVGLHPLLSQSPVVVVPERVDRFPLDVLAGGLDGADG
jgi:predicted kinase